MESITSVIFMYRGGMFSCSLKNGTTMEYRTLDSLLIPCWPRKHSLSGESPGKRQDFVFRCRSGFPTRFAVSPAAASAFSGEPRPHIPGGTSIRLCPPASCAAGALRRPWSTRRSARSRKNGPRSTLPRVPPACVRLVPAALAGAQFAGGKGRPQAGRLVRDANRPYSVPLGQPQRNLKQSGQHVHVFVTIQVRRLDSRIAHLGDLRAPLHFHFAHGESACRDLEQQAIRAALELPGIVQQTRDRRARRDR